MKRFSGLLALAIGVSIFLAPARAGTVGDFSIRAANPLEPAQVVKLRELVKSHPEAAALAKEVRDEAAPQLEAAPRPLEKIRYEGLVNTDPRRIADVEKLKEMDTVALLTRYWQVSGDPKAEGALRRFVKAWAATYKPTGNDVNENKLYSLLVAYHQVGETFPEDERKDIEAWMRGLGKLHLKAVKKSEFFTNRYTKHVRLVAILGRILDEPEWRAEADKGFKRFVTESLRPDGTSLDLERRDTLTYHASALRPVIELAMLAGEEGRGLYEWESEKGGALKKSVDYVVPYAMGEKTRKEWSNTTVELDRKRAAEGLEEYRQGRLYDPQDALRLMEEASYFDPELTRVVLHLTGSKAKRFPTWQTLVNEAAQ